MSDGRRLIQTCKDHILSVMRGMPECQSGVGTGAGYRLIEDVADLDLGLEGQNGWMTWSLLIAMVQDGAIEVVPGTEKRRRYRVRD